MSKTFRFMQGGTNIHWEVWWNYYVLWIMDLHNLFHALGFNSWTFFISLYLYIHKVIIIQQLLKDINKIKKITAQNNHK